MLIFHPRRSGSFTCFKLIEDGMVDNDLIAVFQKHLSCNASGTEYAYSALRFNGYNCGFNTEFRFAAVNNSRHLSVHISHDMVCWCRAWVTRCISWRSSDRSAAQLYDTVHYRMGGHSYSDSFKSAWCDHRDAVIFWENHSKRSGAEMFSQLVRQFRNTSCIIDNVRKVCKVNYERIVSRSAFCGEDISDCILIWSIRTETVDSFGRDTDNFTIFYKLCRFDKIGFTVTQ